MKINYFFLDNFHCFLKKIILKKIEIIKTIHDNSLETLTVTNKNVEWKANKKISKIHINNETVEIAIFSPDDLESLFLVLIQNWKFLEKEIKKAVKIKKNTISDTNTLTIDDEILEFIEGKK